MSDEPTPVSSCCSTRRKILVGIMGILPEDQCGVPDSELADFMRFDLKTPAGKAVIAFRFCPWCGQERGEEDEYRVVDVRGPGDPPPAEED